VPGWQTITLRLAAAVRSFLRETPAPRWAC
jgi:hypothetical protein